MAKFDKAVQLPKLRAKSKLPLFQIFDGNYYLHRSIHTTPPRLNAEGVPVGAVAGALAMFCSDYSLMRPKYTAIAFDVPGKNFRHELSDQYKLNDPTSTENYEANVQLFILVRLMRLVGFPVLFIQGIEADDVVGALAVQSQEGLLGERVNAVISTGDKDINQFVSKNILCCDTKETGGIMTVDAVQAKFGVPPEQIADYLALMGDANDGISGVPKCGPVTARKLLAEFGSLKAILDTKAGQHGKWSSMLTNTVLASLRRDYKLTRIRTDVAVDGYGPFMLRGCNLRYLQEALRSLGITRLPPLVQAQMTKAELSSSDGLFDDVSTLDKPLVEDSQEWTDLMGCLWKNPNSLWTTAKFKENQ